MSIDCKYNKLGECDIRNSYKITKDGVLQSVLECEDCGKREVDNHGYPPFHKGLAEIYKNAKQRG